MARFHIRLPFPFTQSHITFQARALLLILLVAGLQLTLSSTAFAEPENPKLRNDKCLRCHGKENYSRKGADGEERQLHVTAEKFNQSVHGDRDCVNCHKDIIKIPHRKGIDRKVGCVRCHQDLWAEAQLAEGNGENERLGIVVEQIESYMSSIHARPSIDDQSHTNATCYDCHDAHYITPINSVYKADNKFIIPSVCGRCHTRELENYKRSVHGLEIRSGNTDAAVCSDCHTSHDIDVSNDESGRLAISAQCGSCHLEMMESYLDTYHGKITRLGYSETAKCYDCHGSHAIKRVNEADSMVHNGNRLKTCRRATRMPPRVMSHSNRMVRPTISQNTRRCGSQRRA